MVILGNRVTLDTVVIVERQATLAIRVTLEHLAIPGIVEHRATLAILDRVSAAIAATQATPELPDILATPVTLERAAILDILGRELVAIVATPERLAIPVTPVHLEFLVIQVIRDRVLAVTLDILG